MKNIILSLFICCVYFGSTAQSNPNNSLAIHSSCATALKVCGESDIIAAFHESVKCTDSILPQYFKFDASNSGSFYLNTNSHIGTYTLYGPMDDFTLNSCQAINLGQVDQVEDSLNGQIQIPHDQGAYVLRVDVVNCIYMEYYNTMGIRISLSGRGLTCEETINCEDCIGSFAPDPGKYILSAWVKGDEANRNSNYDNPGISVAFDGVTDSSYFSPSGLIIDGWQRIDGVVEIPPGATNIRIGLYCETGDCLFDDIRFLPTDGSMKSYVYDPSNLKLVAELDERNYATFYEYDEEGKLIRVKKETEKGIMTVKENRNNIIKR